ncbi:Pycsar system effector family protein [Weeksellaceae bacterium A-14]
MSLTDQARDFVEKLFKDKLSENYLYHNFVHTTFVVNRAKEIIAHTEGISEEQAENIVLALWFHDTGYVVAAEGHEEKSVAIMRQFMQEQSVPEARTAAIARLIIATKVSAQPENIAEEIVKDSDCGHFGCPDYDNIAVNLRKEWDLTGCRHFSRSEWNRENLNLLKNVHRFYTPYAQEKWGPVKEKNIRKIEKELEKEDEKKKDKKKDSLEKEPKSDRSVDTLFRITLNNHTRLSDIADSKANILLSVNAIVISVCLSVLVPKLDAPKNSHLVEPTFTLLFFSVCTIIFAILSTKPNVTKTRFSLQDVRDRKVNLLFFGNFYQMAMDDYIQSMEELIKDRNYIYDSMIRDLYYLGKVLDRKYRLLSITYKIFMLGIIVSVIAFAYAFSTL